MSKKGYPGPTRAGVCGGGRGRRVAYRQSRSTGRRVEGGRTRLVRVSWEWLIGFFRNVIAAALGIWHHVEDVDEAEAERQREIHAFELNLAFDQVKTFELDAR